MSIVVSAIASRIFPLFFFDYHHFYVSIHLMFLIQKVRPFIEPTIIFGFA